jgi:predicted nucleotidyltransferase
MTEPIDLAQSAARQAAARHPALTLVVLFGSRARQDSRAASDWDFAYDASQPVDALALRADLVDMLGTDRVDIVPLDRASALVRYRVARDGIPLFERQEGDFARFWLSAVEFWCDVAPLVRAGHEAILAELES